MPRSIRQVQPRLDFIPPAFNPWLLRAVHAVLPLLLRLRIWPWLPAGISELKVVNAATLAQLWQQFQQGNVRLILAFRHVEVDDPLCGLYLLSRTLPQVAKEQGIALQTPLHAHFLYERGMPLWAGQWLGWGLSHLGGISLRRGRQPDWTGLRLARKLVREGDLPLVIAPEGATNGHSERVGPLEPGAAQLAFWCVEDLVKSGQDIPVLMVPIGIQYHYVSRDWAHLARLLTRLEQASAAPRVAFPGETLEKASYLRLLNLAEHLLGKLETFYRRFYHQPLTETSEACRERLAALLEAAIRVAEQYFGLPGRGNLAERCRRVEEAGWTYIYREDLPDRRSLSPLDRGLADWVAQEASLRMLHMRLVETFVAANETYLKDQPSFERCAEMALLMFDLLARVRGEKLPRRPRLGDRRATLTIGHPRSVNERYGTYRTSHRDARQAVADLTAELQRDLEAMIHS